MFSNGGTNGPILGEGHNKMKKTVVTIVGFAALFVGGFAYEWRYSDDMQEHIDSVNRDLENARLEASYSTGLLSSLQTMSSETDVAREIIETHEHVHTLKDEVLAWKLKTAIEQGITVGDAIQIALAKWPEVVQN
jgi:hypothetical protein